MSDLNAPSPTAQAALQQNSAAILHFLQQYPPFNQMEMRHLLRIIELGWLRFYAKGSIITEANNEAEQYWFLIRQGLVRGERPNPRYPDNIERFLLTVGDNFPLAAILSQRSTHTTYTAHEDCFCLVLNAADFVKLLRISEPLRSYAIRGFSSLLSELQQQAQERASAHLGADYSMHDELGSLIAHQLLPRPTSATGAANHAKAPNRQHGHRQCRTTPFRDFYPTRSTPGASRQSRKPTRPHW